MHDLNPKQLAAVNHGSGPLLVLAGAGSGKTRVLVQRVVRLVTKESIPASNILLVTFTNKAAQEMKSRVSLLLNSTSLPWAGTFHSLCAQILRHEAFHTRFSPNFVIYDEQDKLDAIKQSMQKLNISPKDIKPSSVNYAISGAKNELLSPQAYEQTASTFFSQTVAKIYPHYQQLLSSSNALDFDDLIFEVIKLFKANDQVREKYAKSTQHLLVDEYQDTNKAQYELTKILSSHWQNLTVVGDASQAIYSWRGADFRNLLNLKSDFPTLTTINLEQNYRSTQTILDAATAIISHNSSHPVLHLWTSQSEGEAIRLFQAESELAEAKYVVENIKSLQEAGIRLSEIAVLYRTNAQSRIFEEALLHHNLPYKLVGGVRFYERKEIKDVLSYLRLVSNPSDEVSQRRAEKIGKSKYKLFTQLQSSFLSNLPLPSSREILDQILETTSYLSLFDPADSEDYSRLENIKELRSIAEQFPDLTTLLENIALVEKESKSRAQDREGAITLMTLHSAKGLEFDSVFLVGLEEGLFPHSRSHLDSNALEEERRLCYVGITRARSHLHLTYATRRLYFGQRSYSTPSRFISEIPADLVQKKSSQTDYFWDV